MHTEKTCPYPGLRPFNDDESIYFKGRERNIDTIIELFEKKKFMMLTGASGDGKSSLIYAGVVPQARAGLFKAKYNNWAVADFRPERDPMGNFTQAINRYLKFGDAAALKKELSYGFTALVRLYKQSELYLDTEGSAWKAADEAARKQMKRRACNLMIIADQFEEFFTNTENYNKGVASVDSQTVVNLLLETAKIALAEDLPIYVICTMRSDYIGQCAAFRGLPEYIGFSQFFVPRLKRKEIIQVIEEPAQLNGDRITRRLSERLLNDISEGYDQLPILQHALNQIWKMAKNGGEELDLIHYAKVGGLPAGQLPADQQKIFEEWFDTLPEFKKGLFEKPSLENILNAHANELYETAHQEYVDNKVGKASRLQAEESKHIIKTAFQCLTKIDEARAVRNRMSLKEITLIINRQGISTNLVGAILGIFRIQGNTFLKPFVTDDATTRVLQPDQVLDITHESLIRNWDLLNKWAVEENENWLNFQDFNKQLSRWVANNKDKGYLLPIGPLTFFEGWYKLCQPNKYWLARYDEREIPAEQKISDAERTLADAEEFIRKSARRLFFTRTVMKYGADKLLSGLGILLMLFGCIYFYFDYADKQNPHVLEMIEQKGPELLKSKLIKSKTKAEYILASERLNKGIYKDLLKEIEADSSRQEVLIEMFARCLNYQQRKQINEPDNPLLDKLFWDIANLNDNQSRGRFISRSNNEFKNDIHRVLTLVYGHMIMRRCGFKLSNEIDFNNLKGTYLVDFLDLLKDSSTLKKVEVQWFNVLLQAMPEITHSDSTLLSKITERLDPFDPVSKRNFDLLYPRQKTMKFSWGNTDNMSHNAGYFQLANLFALCGDFSKLNQCLDTLLKYNPDFAAVEYGYNGERLIASLINNGKLFTAEGRSFVSRMELNNPKKHEFGIEFLLLNKLGFNQEEVETGTIINFKSHDAFDLQLHWELIGSNRLVAMADALIQRQESAEPAKNDVYMFDAFGNEFAVSTKTTNDPKNYLLALLYKTKANLYNRRESFKQDAIDANFDKAMKCFAKVGENYLNLTINLSLRNGQKTFLRRDLFKYPLPLLLNNSWDIYSDDYIKQFHRSYAMLSFISSTEGLSGFYTGKPSDAEQLNTFLINYFANVPWNVKGDSILDPAALEQLAEQKDLPAELDKNALLSYFALYYSYKLQPDKASRYAMQINFKQLMDKDKIFKNNKNYCYARIAKNLSSYFFKESARATSTTVKENYFKKGQELLAAMPEAFQRRNAYLECIDSLQLANLHAAAFVLLDTFLVTSVAKTPKYGNKLFQILGRISAKQSDKLAMNQIRDKVDRKKFDCLEMFINGKLEAGNYYRAISLVPDYVSSNMQLALYTSVLKTEARKLAGKNMDGWSGMDRRETGWLDQNFEQEEAERMYYTTGE